MSNTAKKINESEKETAQMQVVKNEPVVEAPLAPKEPEMSLEQKINRVEDLNVLIDKFRKLQETFRSLQTFNISADGFSSQVILRDTTNGKEFKTSNSAVVSQILDDVRSVLLTKIAEVESQIHF